MMMRGAPGLAAALAVGLGLSSSALAAEFDARGVLSFDSGAVFTEGFEDYSPGQDMEVVHGQALEGDAFLRIESKGQYAMLPLGVGAGQAACRVRAFVRSNASWYPVVGMWYSDDAGVPFAHASMYPTGRMTDDGWLEIESPPMSVDGARSPSVLLVMRSSSVDLDAVEVVEEPGAYVKESPCSGLAATECKAGQFCLHGFCRNADALVPPLPGPAQRSHLVDLWRQKIHILYGGVFTRQQPMQDAFATLEEMRDASSAWQFWNGLAKMVVQLADAHTSPFGVPNFLYGGVRAFPVCLVEGEADLSHAVAPSDPRYVDVLVSHVGPEKNLGLKPGDRIVAVDGMHPIAWMKTLVGHSWVPAVASDPEVDSGRVENLGFSIAAFARSIEVVRCDAGTGTCTPPQTILTSSFEREDPNMIQPQCDHRPGYHLAENNPDPITHELHDVRHGLLADSQPGENLYGMIWNDTDWRRPQANPWQQAYTDLRAHAQGIILDHRTGNGGTPDGAAYLTELSRKPTKMSVWSLNTTLGLFEEPFDAADGLKLFDRWKNDPTRSWTAGSTTPREDIRIALLLARDVSGSDFFPFGVKGAPNTRLFGRKTMGAFSTYLTFETASFLGFTLASGDFIDTLGAPQIGHGVEPDEELVPLQSDLLVGRDTVYERALEWVRCGQEGCR